MAKKETQNTKTLLKQNMKNQSNQNIQVDKKEMAESKEQDNPVVVINTSMPNIIQKALDEKRLFLTECGMFFTGIVYAYGDIKLYLKLVDTLLDGKLPYNRPSAVACYTFGRSKSNVSNIGQIGIVFVDNQKVSLEESIPVFAHEISHLADMIIDSVGVKDSSGETKAYFIEHEMQKVLAFFYGNKHELGVTAEKIMEALQ